MNWSSVGAFLLAIAVGLGAFGAHGLRDRLDAYSMGIWERAVFYHFIHALGLLALGIMGRVKILTPTSERGAGALLLAGIALFSGSLYILALTGVRTLGAVTPLGGVAFIVAWCWLGAGLAKKS